MPSKAEALVASNMIAAYRRDIIHYCEVICHTTDPFVIAKNKRYIELCEKVIERCQAKLAGREPIK